MNHIVKKGSVFNLLFGMEYSRSLLYKEYGMRKYYG